MKIRAMVRSGMLCAVYGLFIVLNVFSGLWIESVFPYLFALPVLVAALDNRDRVKVTLCAFGAMLLITFLLSGLTTWLIAGSMLASGLTVGIGLAKRWNWIGVFLGSFAILFGLAMLEMTVLASLFGFDFAAETQGFEMLFAWITPFTLIVFVALVQAFLETLACFLCGILLESRLMPGQKTLVFGGGFKVPAWMPVAFFVLFGLWTVLLNRNEENLYGWRDLCFLLSLLGYVLLVIQGYLVLMKEIAHRAVGLKGKKPLDRKTEKAMVFVLTFVSLVPITNLVPFGVGVYDRMAACIRHLKRYRQAG